MTNNAPTPVYFGGGVLIPGKEGPVKRYINCGHSPSWITVPHLTKTYLIGAGCSFECPDDWEVETGSLLVRVGDSDWLNAPYAAAAPVCAHRWKVTTGFSRHYEDCEHCHARREDVEEGYKKW